MKLENLCTAADIPCPPSAKDREIGAIETDSRKTGKNTLFVCIRGLHTDGHAYIGEAVERGCTCILTEEGAVFDPLPPEVICLSCPDTRRATAMLYNAWYGYPTRQLSLIGVTGTNGKTSVTHMLRAILEAAFYRCGLIGTVGCESVGRHLDSRAENALANMTTPDPAVLYRVLSEMVADGVEYVLMEVTSHALALGKLAPMHFRAAIFTNLTPEHLDFHKTMEAYAAAKAELMANSDLCVINGDSPYAGFMQAQAAGRVVTCSEHGRGDYNAEHLSFSGDGCPTYDLHSVDGCLRIPCAVPGRFSVMNSMQAAAVARELGIGAKTVKDAVSSLFGVKGRMERVKLGLGADFTVLIDYAHTPDALENLLRTTRLFCQRGARIVLLFGCGGDRDQGKRPMMGRIASENADFVILTSDNSRSEDPMEIISAIRTGMNEQADYCIIPDRAQAIEYAVRQARSGDILLLAGKGHEEYEIRRDGKFPFCEKEIVRQAFLARRRDEKREHGEP